MRKKIMLTLVATLLASAVAPTMASAQEWRGGHERRDDRHDNRHDRRDDRHDNRYERRDDRREDWRGYREAHGDVFRGPAYVGPRGYAYRPIEQGHRFAPQYYNRRYWVNDPAQYRLPPAPRHQRWVRYGHDVVRVDITTGRALQIYGSFFL
jgi:Ni/Co efflux regulator RcnB